MKPKARVFRSRTAGVALLLMSLLVTAAGFLAQDASLPYRKAATWQATLLAAREAMHDPADVLEGVYAGPWEISGSYQGNRKTGIREVFEPETGGTAVKWTPRAAWNDGEAYGIAMAEDSAVYLRRSIFSPAEREVPVSLGSKDGIMLWVNGKQVLSDAAGRGRLQAGQVRGVLPLQKGGNVVLLKIWNRRGPQHAGLYFSMPRPVEISIRRRMQMERLWERVRADFPSAAARLEMAREQRDAIWFEDWPSGDRKVLAGRYAGAVHGRLAGEARRLAAKAATVADLEAVRAVYNRARNVDEIREMVSVANPEAARLAIKDLIETFGVRYPKGAAYLEGLAQLEKPLAEARAGADDDATLERLGASVRRYHALSREALLANPMLDFDKLLLLRRDFGPAARRVMSKSLGMPVGNSWTLDDVDHTGWDNQIAVLTDLRGEGRLHTFYQPEGGKVLGEIQPDFDARKIMFSSIGSSDRWRLFEINADATGLRQITPDIPDVDHFDSCYLPSGKIAFTSTAGYQAMPCINGGAPMAQMYTCDRDGRNIRQITFEQDSDWCPRVLNDGRLMYLRWEYTDIPHYFSRLLFHSNPDGTAQMEYFHSNSYFPNSFFYARPIPGHPSEVVGIASGHHGISRSGRLLLVDPALGRREAEGVVQEIPGRGRKVVPIIRDPLVDGVWPQFIHPYPLADYSTFERPAHGGKYFLVAMKRDARSLWGIYLVDTFDNLTLIKEVEGAALLEPVPFRAVPRPPVIPDRTQPGNKEATVYLTDVYSGQGLVGYPRGTVKRLRILSYHYNYNFTGGHASVGVQSGWDIKRILGTVPVEEDGSASFRIPANTPVTVQPLDSKGRAVQLMRSWLVGMPGEVVSCVGCHDRQSSTPPVRPSIASRRAPSVIEPWYGPPRPFGFQTEVQPVLDRYCAGCHDGRAGRPDFRYDPKADYFLNDRAYLALHPYVHRTGPEPDYAPQKPMEYHASTSELFQLLEKGHHGVKLDKEAWDRLYAWADLNVPWRGSWGQGKPGGAVPLFRGLDQVKRRIELAKRYANVDTDPEGEFAAAMRRMLANRGRIQPVIPAEPPRDARVPQLAGWPFDAAEAARRQKAAGRAVTRSIEPAPGVKMELVLVPAGRFVMGDAAGERDESPAAIVNIGRPFWMGKVEVSNRLYALFDPHHDSRFVDKESKDHDVPGYPANLPDQPVIRVTWEQAQAFCKWLSARTGERVTLPTEAQWEWAARAGTATPLWFGGADSDFGAFANLADKRIGGFHIKMTPFILFQPGVDDGEMITGPVGKYRANPWGLVDMHGNVAEWTRSMYRAYPYDPGDGRDDLNTPGLKVVRGGSWRDRPHRARSAYRLAFEPYQPVYNVGFRVAVETAPAKGRAEE